MWYDLDVVCNLQCLAQPVSNSMEVVASVLILHAPAFYSEALVAPVRSVCLRDVVLCVL